MPHRFRIAALLPLEGEYSSRLMTGAIQFVKENPRFALVDMPYPMDNPGSLKLRAPFPFDAAMLWATEETPWVKPLIFSGMPLVNCSSDIPSEKVTRVCFDPESAVTNAVDHLAGIRPAILVNLEFRVAGVPAKERRVEMFHREAKRRGISSLAAQVLKKDGSDDGVVVRRQPLQSGPARRLRVLLQKLPRPAGIWCGDDTLALRVCEAAREMGLRVPEDIAVLGFGDFNVAACGLPPVSSIPLHGEMIGHRGFSALAARLSGESIAGNVVSIPLPPVVVRESTALVPHGDPVERARRIIADRACKGLTIAEVARQVSLTPQTLYSRYMQKVGLPPGEEIRLVKLSAAKRFLSDSRLSISRVAHLCGFNQQSKFANFFKRASRMMRAGFLPL